MKQTRNENEANGLEYEYPFYTTKHLNKTGINEDLVKVSQRNLIDFCDPLKP